MLPFSYNVRNLTVRKTTTFVTAFGIALVVFVLSASLMLKEGISRTLASTGSPDVAIVLRKGSDSELASSIENASVGLITSAPGVAKRSNGQGNGVGELVVVLALEKRGADGVSNVQFRGVPDNALEFRPQVKILSGRPAQPGTDEVIVGKKIAGRFKGLELGQEFEIRKRRACKVVGIFEANGDSYESEVWGDINTVRTAFGRNAIVSAVRVRLASPDKFSEFEAAVEQDKRLGLEAEHELVFYEKQGEMTATFMGVLGTMIAVFFSFGAMIGAMITMYGAVSTRKRELGTMRALGFSRRVLLTAVLLESLLLALAGGVAGALAAMAMGFVEFSMMNFATWSEMVFTFRPTFQIVGISLLAAVGMGLLGGLFPAIRAARISPVEAMRA